MLVRRTVPAHSWAVFLVVVWLCLLTAMAAVAAPYAAMVMDARTGEVLYSRNADARLHPASLTKMMTLYIAFEAVEHGEISLDTMVRVSRNAASEPPSKLGLKPGQKIALRYLIRAAAVKSANDAATAIGEAIAGSEEAFARRMNRTAKALGMTRTTFKNANGLTRPGHLSTARDMTILGRHILYDYPQYYNLFSRRSTNAGVRTVRNTNRRLLAAYRGADGIKTGYTQAAGFNLVASAQRGNKRIIATVFGGKSSAWRNAKVAELLDLGFRRAPANAPLRKPGRPVYDRGGAKAVVVASTAVRQSPRPQMRPARPLLVADAVADAVADVLAEAVGEESGQARAEATPDAAGSSADLREVVQPKLRPSDIVQASLRAAEQAAPEREVVTRFSTSGGQFWGVNVGRYPTRYEAEKVLLRTALAEMATLDGSLRKVVQTSRGFDANFLGLTQEQADLACRRLQARGVPCSTIGPS